MTARLWMTIGKVIWPVGCIFSIEHQACLKNMAEYVEGKIARSIVHKSITDQQKAENALVIQQSETDLTQIEPWLFLSGVSGVRAPSLVEKHHVKCIISIGVVLTVYDTHFHGKQDIDYRFFALEDEPDAPLMDVLIPVCALLEKNEKEGIVTSIHCFAGISRSASCVIAFEMRKLLRQTTAIIKQSVLFQRVFEWVSEKRSFIDPNYGFRRILKRELGVLTGEQPAKRALTKEDEQKVQYYMSILRSGRLHLDNTPQEQAALAKFIRIIGTTNENDWE